MFTLISYERNWLNLISVVFLAKGAAEKWNLQDKLKRIFCFCWALFMSQMSEEDVKRQQRKEQTSIISLSIRAKGEMNIKIHQFYVYSTSCFRFLIVYVPNTWIFLIRSKEKRKLKMESKRIYYAHKLPWQSKVTRSKFLFFSSI